MSQPPIRTAQLPRFAVDIIPMAQQPIRPSESPTASGHDTVATIRIGKHGRPRTMADSRTQHLPSEQATMHKVRCPPQQTRYARGGGRVQGPNWAPNPNRPHRDSRTERGAAPQGSEHRLFIELVPGEHRSPAVSAVLWVIPYGNAKTANLRWPDCTFSPQIATNSRRQQSENPAVTQSLAIPSPTSEESQQRRISRDMRGAASLQPPTTAIPCSGRRGTDGLARLNQQTQTSVDR